MKRKNIFSFLSLVLAFVLATNSVDVFALTENDSVVSDEVIAAEMTDSFDIVDEEIAIDEVVIDAINNEEADTAGSTDASSEDDAIASAPAEEEIAGSIVGTYVEPIYEEIITDEIVKAWEEELQADAILNASDDEILEASSTDRKGLVKAFKENALARNNNTFSYTFKTNKIILLNDLSEILDDAFIDSPSSITDGDYLRANNVGFSFQNNYSYKSGKWVNNLNIKLKMNTTAEQELKVDAAVKQILSDLAIESKANDYEKIKALYIYLADSVQYDDAAAAAKDPEAYGLRAWSAYGALCERFCVCQGYAGAMYRLLRESGIDCRFVTGLGNGGAHAWNIVQLGDYYYNIDSTWDADPDKIINNGNTLKWFMLCPDDFTKHVRDDMYTTSAFNSAYPMAANSFKDGDPVPTPTPVRPDGIEMDASKDTTGTIPASSFEVANIASQTYTGDEVKPSVKVKCNGKKLKRNVDYVLGYSNNVYPSSNANVSIIGIGQYKGIKKVNFTINPKPIKKAKFMATSLPKAKVKITKSLFVVNYTADKDDVLDRIFVYDGSKLLKYGQDYDIYAGNGSPGKFNIVIEGKGNYSGKKNAALPMIGGELIKIVNGAELNNTVFGTKPTKESIVKSVYTTSGNAIPAGNYSVSFKNTKAGVSYAVIKGKSGYKGTVVVPYLTAPMADSGSAPALTVSLKSTKPIYADGTPKMPAVVVKANVNGKVVKLKKDIDYKVTYANCFRPGTATIKVKGINNYEGSTAANVDFTILNK